MFEKYQGALHATTWKWTVEIILFHRIVFYEFFDLKIYNLEA